MSSSETKLPYGAITGKKLIMHFSAFDIDLPVIASGLRERMDVLREMDVAFAGFGTEIPANMSEQAPASVKCFFEYVGKEADPTVILKRAYHLVWSGMIDSFPDLEQWAAAKADLSNLTLAQAEVLRARKGE
jgi:NADPH-dependent curcumin reductase CurA